MTQKIDQCLVVGISSRALFELDEENEIFKKEGLKEYEKYQIQHENDILKPGSGFALVKALLKLNELQKDRLVEVIIMSHNSADTSLRIFNSIAHYHLDITRTALSGGESIAPYLHAFAVDLFLSADEKDVQIAINEGVAAGVLYTDQLYDHQDNIKQIRIAFDGDAVLFSDESEKIYKEKGLEAFVENETKNAKTLLPEGPFAPFLKLLSNIQARFDKEEAPIRTALVTARNVPAHERVVRTLRAWNVRVDEAFFLGGLEKKNILKAFGAHIFFDDQEVHAKPASQVVPSARVPYKQHKEDHHE